MPPTTVGKIIQWLGVDPNPVSHTEKAVATLGAFVGIFLTAWISLHVVQTPAAIMIVGSVGASAVLLFAVPHGQLTQPWALLGGHLVSAFVGVSCVKFVPGGLIFVAALAVSLAIGAMHITRCIHPPGGATALIAVIGGAGIHDLGYGYVLIPIGLNALLILLVAVAFNYPFAWRRYPAALHTRHEHVPPTPSGIRLEDIELEDIEHALHALDTPIDVPEEELQLIYELAEQHAIQRHAGNPKPRQL